MFFLLSNHQLHIIRTDFSYKSNKMFELSLLPSVDSNKMAVVASRFDPGLEFSRSEAELQDHVLDVYGTREHEVDLFRYYL